MIPSDLKSLLMYSHNSWELSQGFGLEPKGVRFKLIKLQSSNPEVQLVFCYFEANKPDSYSAGCVTYILNSDLHTNFCAHLIQIKRFPKDVEAYYSNRLLQAKRENCVEEQIFCLENLSDLYLQKKNWTQAAKLINCALAILEKSLDNADRKTHLKGKLERIETLFLQNYGYKIPNHHKGSVFNYRNWLKNIRELYLKQFNEKVAIEKLVVFLSNSYRKLLGSLILDSQELLGTAPTRWASIGMGSMARDEMCPYSDLEFAFLIDKKTEDVLEYFRILSQLIEIRIINLGETRFPIFHRLFGHNDLRASPTPGGFSLDTGGNTPLGKPGLYELIDTPNGLAQYQCVKSMEEDIIITNALTTTCHIVGDASLVSAYNYAKIAALNSTDGIFFFSGTPFRHKLALKLLKGNLQEFKPNLSKEKQETNAFGIKKELYRPLQSLMGVLSLYCGLELKSTVEMIQQLLQQQILSVDGAKNLTKALNQILSLRFEAHTFYQNEEEFLLHVEQGKDPDPHFLYLDEERLKILHDIYMVLIPLQQCGEEFAETQDINIFAKATFFDDSPYVQGKAFEKTLQYASAQEAYQKAVSLNPNDFKAQFYLGGIENELGKGKEALQRVMQALALAQQKYDENHPELAQCYNSIGSIYANLGDYENALEFCQKALKIDLLDANPAQVAVSYNNIGCVYDGHGDNEKALESFQKALETWPLLLGENHSYLAGIYNNLGGICSKLGDQHKSLEYHQKAVEIKIRVLGENHPIVAKSYNNIGFVYENQANFNKAIEFFQKALKIWFQVLGEKHPNVATSYNNIGSVYDNLGDYKQALEFYEKASKIQCSTLGEKHPHLARTFNNKGDFYLKCGDLHKAREFFQKALNIRLAVLNKDHPDVAQSYNNIGSVCIELGDFEKALEAHQKALKIWLQVLGENHSDVATSYNNIGIVYMSLGQYRKTLEFYQKSLRILLSVYTENHPNVASSYNNIGLVYNLLGNSKNALEFCKKGLELRLLIHDKDHPNMVSSYNNLGMIYNILKDNDKALEFHQKALKIQLEMFGESHAEVATSYNNIGSILNKRKEYHKAIEYHQKALKIQLELLGENHPQVATSYNNIGLVRGHLGDDYAALEFYQISLIILLKAYKKNHPHIELGMSNLINCAKKISIDKLKTLKDVCSLCVQIIGMQNPRVQELVRLLTG